MTHLAHHQEIDDVAPASASQQSIAIPRVALVVGDNRTLHCGVKDYAHALARALTLTGVHADVLAPDAWDRASVAKFQQRLRAGSYDICHLQYPSVGCRASLRPHFLGLFGVAIPAVTVHEHSALPTSQRLSLQVLRATTSAMFWVSEYERSSFNRHLGSLGASQHVVPIGSNVPAIAASGAPNRTVVYFGQIRRNKGLEAFLELARLSIQEGREYNFHVMGSVTPSNQTYAREVQSAANPAVGWSFDLPFDEVGAILANCLAAYLPFPDGASERRGSMLAALLNGSPVLSRVGPATLPDMARVMIAVESATEAMSELDRLVSEPEARAHLSRAGRQYAERNSWSSVAETHASIYRDLLQNHRRG